MFHRNIWKASGKLKPMWETLGRPRIEDRDPDVGGDNLGTGWGFEI